MRALVLMFGAILAGYVIAAGLNTWAAGQKELFFEACQKNESRPHDECQTIWDHGHRIAFMKYYSMGSKYPEHE